MTDLMSNHGKRLTAIQLTKVFNDVGLTLGVIFRMLVSSFYSLPAILPGNFLFQAVTMASDNSGSGRLFLLVSATTLRTCLGERRWRRSTGPMSSCLLRMQGAWLLRICFPHTGLRTMCAYRTVMLARVLPPGS